jgi:hypothetical protein
MIKNIWNKYGLVIAGVLAIYAAYKTVTPAEVKIIKTEHFKNVSSTTTEKKVKKAATTQSNQSRQYARDIKKDEVIVEIIYPDGRIERSIHKATSITTKGTASSTTDSTASTAVDSQVATTNIIESTGTTTTEQKSHKFWVTAVGVGYKKDVYLGQGIAINDNISALLLGSYSLEIMPIADKWDIAGLLLFKY